MSSERCDEQNRPPAVPRALPEPGRGAVLVTGATGFLGQAISAALERRGISVVRGRRSPMHGKPAAGRWVEYGEIGPDTDWAQALSGITSVVHLAGIAHVEQNTRDLDAFDRVNVQGTHRLASLAAAHGIRFILMSSALVHGSVSRDHPIAETDGPRPASAYARSKLGAEQRLEEVAAATAMEFVILRPPMVYGANARGNFLRLVHWVNTGLPLPLGRATAPRSFIGVDNLADAVACCLEQPALGGEKFLVGDPEVSSTAELIEKIASALGRRIVNFKMPPGLIRGSLRCLDRQQDFDRLFAPFQLDTAHITRRLGWKPPLSLAEGIVRAVRA